MNIKWKIKQTLKQVQSDRVNVGGKYLRDTSRADEFASRARLRAVSVSESQRAMVRGQHLAFTLAETLITLGIIGIVSAMTIPNIITHYQQQKTVTKLKKAYSQVNQALLLSVADNGDYDGWDNPEEVGEDEYFKKYWLPYFKGITLCKNYNVCKYSLFNGSGATGSFKALNGDIVGVDAINSGRSSILLPDGTVLINFVKYGSSAKTWLYIDINGAELPNTIGKDVFTFERNERGIIIPRCNSSNLSTVNADCSKTGQGLCCAQKIINDGWTIAKDYPW
ncbi:type II secretion system protein [bacterium]|nr:type II secretion system protein [bacterium]